MQFSVAIISLFVAHVAAVAAPDPAQVTRLSTSIQVRNGQEVGFIPAVSAAKRDSDGFHNFCTGPCQGWYCTVGANPQCCLTDRGCGCCWFMDGAAYFAETHPADKQSKNGGILDAGSVKDLSDKNAPNRRPQSQYKVGSSKSKGV